MTKVSVLTKLTVPADEVWALIGEWNALPTWHPGVQACALEGGGLLRRVRLADGTELVEKLESVDAVGRTYTYSVTSGLLPFSDYLATITVREDGAKCIVEWSGTFRPAGASETDVVQMISDFYQEGVSNIKRLLGV